MAAQSQVAAPATLTKKLAMKKKEVRKDYLGGMGMELSKAKGVTGSEPQTYET